MNNTLTLGKRPHSCGTVLETPDRNLRSVKTGVSGVVRSFRFWLRWCLPGSGSDILTRGPEAAPEVTPESPDWVLEDRSLRCCWGSLAWVSQKGSPEAGPEIG